MKDPVWWFWEWTPAEEVTRECKRRMDVVDKLPAIVRYAIHEAPAYTDPLQAKRWVRRYGAEGGGADPEKEGYKTKNSAARSRSCAGDCY